MSVELLDLKERTSANLNKDNRVTKEGVMKGVHLIGLIGKSNKAPGASTPYKYKESAIKKAVELKVYEGVDSYFGHSKDDGSARDPRDRAGLVLAGTVTHKEGVGAIADIQLDPKHPNFESLCWWANNHPDRVMMSHEAKLKYNKLENTIDEIMAVESVDFVIEGNTTTAMFKEGVLRDKITAEDKDREVERIVNTFRDLACNIMYPLYHYDTPAEKKVLTQAEKAVMLAPIAKDLVKELQAISLTTKEAIKKEDQMDFKAITIEDLAKNRPELVALIGAEAVSKENAITTKVAEAVKDVPEAKRSVVFLKLVKEAVIKNDAAAVTELVNDRTALIKESVTSTVVKAESAEEILAKEKATKKSDAPSDDQILAALK